MIDKNKLKSFLLQYGILIGIVLLKLGLQYALVNPTYDLHRDEYLHLDQAFHPAAGYISVPPFTSWVAGLIYLLGGGVFWIRFFPALFGALTLVFAWLTVETLGGKLAAKLLVSVSLLFSVYVRLNVLFQPNSFDILVWTMLFYLLIKYFQSRQDQWLYLAAVTAALGLYNKYTVLFLLVGLLIGILITYQRTLFEQKSFYKAAALCLLLFLPNIVWQITNDFPVLHHMEVLKQRQLININRADFLIDQIKYGVVGFVTVSAFWALLFSKVFRPYRFVGHTFLIVMLLFILSRAKSYYTLGLFPVLFALGGVYLEQVFKKWKIVLFLVLAGMHVGAFFFAVRYLMPYQDPAQIVANPEPYEKLDLLRWEDGKNHPLPQDFSDMLGWREMAGKALKGYHMIPENERERTMIFCDNYGQTGALNYYNRYKMPPANSFTADYIFWLPKHMEIKHILFVGELPEQEVLDLFKEFKLVGTVENEFAREKGTNIYLLLGAKESATEIFYREANERKNNLDIF